MGISESFIQSEKAWRLVSFEEAKSVFYVKVGYKSPIRFLNDWLIAQQKDEAGSMNPTSWKTKNRGNLSCKQVPKAVHRKKCIIVADGYVFNCVALTFVIVRLQLNYVFD